MTNLALILLALFLVLLNGFFVAAEFAIVKLRMTQAQELASTHRWRGRVLLGVRGNLDAYLSACQLGITLASLGLGWIGEPAVASTLRPFLLELDLQSEALLHSLSFAIAFGLISYLHIVLGELAPKSLAIRRSETIALWTAVPLWAFYWLMYPFIRVLNGSANLILKTIGVELANEGDEAHSVFELKQVLVASHRHGEIDQEEVDILTHALELSDLTAGDLMRPAADMVVLDLADSPQVLRRIVNATRFSRYPVCEGDRDRLVGIVHIKDLWDATDRGFSTEQLRRVLRKLPEVNRETAAPALFRMFRSGGPHLTVVRDDLGTVVGFVTLDHVLEAMVGRIEDEFRRLRDDWTLEPDGSYLGSATLPVYSLERLLGIEISPVDADSIGGIVLERLGTLPQPGERIVFEGFDVVVLDMHGPRIGRVRILPHRSADAQEAASADDGTG